MLVLPPYIHLSLSLTRFEKPLASSWLDNAWCNELDNLHVLRRSSLSLSVHPRIFHSFYNRESRHPIIILLPKRKASSHESARLSRISQTHSNQPDSLSRFQPRNPADPRPQLPSTEPLPSTATHSLGSRPCRLIRHQGTSRAHSGSWGMNRVGHGPFVNRVVRLSCAPLVGF